MKAYVLHAINDFRYEDVAQPELKSGWCLVKVKACGICSSDIPRVFTKGTYHFPTIPGHEFSGIVEKVYDKENEELLGKRVGCFPLIPCRDCEPCKNGHYEMCEHYDYMGSRRDGGFAEYVVVPVWNLIEIPKKIPFEIAAMLEPLAVALHAVKQSGITHGQTAAVIGTGMIGFAAGQWLLMSGAKNVTVIGRNENKRKIAESISDIKYISSYNKDNPPLFDVVIEAVGTPSSIIQSIQLINAGGNLVLMGNPSGDVNIPQNVYWRILRKQLHVIGTWNSIYEKNHKCDWEDVVKALSENKIKTDFFISHKFAQDKVKKGFELMYKKQEPYCKVMTIWNSGE